MYNSQEAVKLVLLGSEIRKKASGEYHIGLSTDLCLEIFKHMAYPISAWV